MNQFTQRIIGFGVHAGHVEDVAGGNSKLQPHCITSVGRPTAEGYTSFLQQLEYPFAMHRLS